MSEAAHRAVLLFGAPGVGKGTQGKILGGIPGFFHLSSGDVFRSIDADTDLGRETQPYTAHGNLVPDELTLKIYREAIQARIVASDYHPADDVVVLDGIPRNVNQARQLSADFDVLRVITLDYSDDQAMVERIHSRAVLEGRADDADEEIIRRRFEIFRRESAPVLGFYPEEIVSRVDATGTPLEVLHAILTCLLPVQKRQLEGQTH